MPVSHTCFFQFDLPAYSSEAKMKEKIIYAIYNSTAIDADDTGEVCVLIIIKYRIIILIFVHINML